MLIIISVNVVNLDHTARYLRRYIVFTTRYVHCYRQVDDYNQVCLFSQVHSLCPVIVRTVKCSSTQPGVYNVTAR